MPEFKEVERNFQEQIREIKASQEKTYYFINKVSRNIENCYRLYFSITDEVDKHNLKLQLCATGMPEELFKEGAGIFLKQQK